MRIHLGFMNTRIAFSRSILAAMFLMLAAATLTLADVKPSALFSDHMVLQSGMEVPIWGTASPGERVTVTLNAQKQSAVAHADGKWMVRLEEPRGRRSVSDDHRRETIRSRSTMF